MKMANTVPLSKFINQCRIQVDNVLSAILPVESNVSPRLLEAMRYSVFNGGKRIRPILAYAACHAFGAHVEQANPAACAVELIHAYSLVHDDLPAMDDDDLRRGKPSCHKVYDEASAILAGDTLQSLAFEVLGNVRFCPESPLNDSIRLQLVNILSQASGLAGMAGGQAMDQCATGQVLNQQQLELMHSHKTGALIRASVRMGAICAGPFREELREKLQEEKLRSLDLYARVIGLAFQVRDDILDITADTKTLGKHPGADMALEKPTYVSLMGLEQAKVYAEELHYTAIGALSGFDHSADFLRQIADYIVRRSY